tara:strand:+ start:6799 stop:7803 length:1005 start_codon:yes stop_codon:yes gene_type:complete
LTSQLSTAVEDAPEIKSRGAAELRAERQEEAILDATWCYYHEGLNQNQIADKLGLSRASVVNYLAEARRRDYVRISLDPDIFRSHQQARALVVKFGLKDASVVPAAGQRTAERVARMTADWLPQLLTPGDRLGVAWGETIFRVAEAAAPQILEDLTVVQLVGSRPASMGFAAETCSATLAQRFGAHCINLHVPLLVSDADLAARLRSEPVIAEQLQAVAACNKVLFACGTCHADSHIVQTGILSAAALQTYVAKGAAGVICGRLIDSCGRHMPTENEDRMLGVLLEQMQGKDMALLASAGLDRADAVLAALNGGFVTHLAVCSATARHLLEADA